MTDVETTDGSTASSGTTRRTVVKAVAWSVPMMAAAVAAPAAHASAAPPSNGGLVGVWTSPTYSADRVAKTTLTVTNTSTRQIELPYMIVRPTVIPEMVSLTFGSTSLFGIPSEEIDGSRFGLVSYPQSFFEPDQTIVLNVYVGPFVGSMTTLAVEVPADDYPVSFATVDIRTPPRS